MKKSLWALLLTILTASNAFGQTITATITDSPDGTAWASLNGYNATYAITLVNSSGVPVPAGQAYRVDTGATVTNTANGNMDATGTFSVTLVANANIIPAGTKWQGRFCPAVSNATCNVVTFTVTASGTLSTQLSAGAVAPRIGGSQGSYAYNTTEVAATPGSTFYNITTAVQQCYTSTWGACGGGGGSGLPTATTSGQVPTSTGAGTTYTAQTPATPGMTLIQKITGTGTPNNLTFSAIPQTYQNLKIMCNFLITSGANLSLQFNGDSTAAHYAYGLQYQSNGTAGTLQSNSSTHALVGASGGAVTIEIPNYTAAIANGVNFQGLFGTLTIGSLTEDGAFSDLWTGTDVTSIALADSGGSALFTSTSTCSLYGLQ